MFLLAFHIFSLPGRARAPDIAQLGLRTERAELAASALAAAGAAAGESSSRNGASALARLRRHCWVRL
eukprot:g1155.t1